MTAPAVQVTDATLAYRLSHNRAGSFKEFAIRLVKGQVQYEQLFALNGVSFEVHPGEVLAVIGPNGAGKSTLMKLVARVLPPNSGRVVVRGRVAPMIELGAGFNPELTGLENIILYGTLLGRSPKHMRARAPEIARWAALEEFLDVPLRSYSSGMVVRLGFSIAIDTEPDVLLVDEVLSVGDESFRRKSKGRIESLIASGTAVVLVSHALDTVLEIADRVLWLDHGRMKMLADPESTVAAYRASV